MPTPFTFWSTAAAILAVPWSWTLAEKQNIQYYFRPEDASVCNIGGLTRSECGKDDKYGGCAYAPNASSPMLWCCPPGDAACWGWRQSCTAGKKICRSGDTTWCCDDVYEDCEFGDGKRNLCVLKTDFFRNPLETYPATLPPDLSATSYTRTIEVTGVTVLYLPAVTAGGTTTVISTTPTTFQRSSVGTPTNPPPTGTLGMVTSPENTTNAAASGVRIPGGAVAGIVVGVVLLIGSLTMSAFLLIKQRRQQRADQPKNMEYIFPTPPLLIEFEGSPITPHHQELETRPWRHEIDGRVVASHDPHAAYQ